ncbi:MAG: GHKL domain-containing protein [Eubacteriales bacterium]|nr:GHKL domain-containing protein [Eubacteriales bacterium]
MIERLYCVVELFAVLIGLFYFYDQSFRLNIKNIVLLSLDVILISLINTLHFPQTYTFVLYIFLAAYCGFEFGFSLKKIVINGMLTVLLINLLQTSGAFLYLLLSKGASITAVTYLGINTYTLCMVVLVGRYLRLHRISRFLQEKNWVNYGLILFVGLLLLGYMFLYKYQNHLDVYEYLILMACVAYGCVLTAFWVKHKNVALEKSVELETQRLYSKAYENMIDDIRSRQHDFDNHLNTILSQHYLYHDYEMLVKQQSAYIEDLRVDNRYNKVLIAGNSVIVGFLYGKFIEIEKYGIEVIYRLSFRELCSSVPDYRLISVLGNLLDNAMDAVAGRSDDKQIRVTIIEQDDSITMEVGNVSEEIDRNEIAAFFKKKYSKKGENRGYGLYNVKKICDEYDMQLICENVQEDNQNWLIFRITIPKNK